MDKYISEFAVAKICGYDGSFDDFKKMYDQYCNEIESSIPQEKPQPAKVEAITNPFRNNSR